MSEKDDVLILAIESSCDETAAAVVKNGREVLSNVINTQIAIHTEYGGVVPEIASRKHIENINPVIRKALEDAGVTLDDIDAIGVTYGPGLVGALLVGVAEAKAIAFAKNKPLVGVHHIEGHISANYVENKELEPPFVALVVSGGHTHLVKVNDYGEYEIVGRTRDDAAGEAFDKVARAIGLGYPGGPKIDKAAKEGNPDAIAFPRAKVEDAPYDFSFSGVKSAVLNYINGCQMKGESYSQADIAASFQKAVTDVLVANAMHAVEEYGVDKFAIAGGVASNTALRAAMKEACEKKGVKFYYPSPIYCTDNAAMIGVAGYYEYIKGIRDGWDLNAKPNLISFNKLAPNITGIAKKNVNSAAISLDTPMIRAPTIVAPDLDVPGINANIWKNPIHRSIDIDKSAILFTDGLRPALRFSITINRTP